MLDEEEFDLVDFLPYALTQAAEAAALGFQKYYKRRYGMLRTEWRVLFHLGRYGPQTAKDICERAGMHKTKVSRAVASLEKRRFLERNVMKNDRRHEMLSLRSQGTAAFKDLTFAAVGYNNSLIADFSDKEQAILKRCLEQLAVGKH